jgi:hypothetical protein
MLTAREAEALAEFVNEHGGGRYRAAPLTFGHSPGAKRDAWVVVMDRTTGHALPPVEDVGAYVHRARQSLPSNHPNETLAIPEAFGSLLEAFLAAREAGHLLMVALLPLILAGIVWPGSPSVLP